MTEPLHVLGSLRIEDGRRWADAAHDFQLEDAHEILAGEQPYHYLTRSRGGSKTTDLAGVALAMLMAAAPRSRWYWLAADREQGQLAIDAVGGFVDRTPALAAAVTVTSSMVEVTASGARLIVLAADAASSWGLLPDGVFCDELAYWADAPAPRRLWESVSSAVAKRPGARLVVLTTAGDPSHFAHGVLEHAVGSPLWRVHELPGPAPWMDADRLAEQRSRLSESMYARLFLNRWTAPEDRLTTADDLRECVTLDGPLEYDPAHRYVVTVDLGLKRDRTVAVVAHRDGRRVVQDRMAVWVGSRAEPVSLEAVEDWVFEVAVRFGRARVVADPWQAVGMLQRLRGRGLVVDEFPFTAASVGRLAGSLFNALRDRALALPPDEELLDELAHVRLRESSPGVFRLDHDAGRHDDRAVALGLAVTVLLQDPTAPTFDLSALMGRRRPHELLRDLGDVARRPGLWRGANPGFTEIDQVVEEEGDGEVVVDVMEGFMERPF